MKKLWINVKMPAFKKLQYYNAVVRAKLTYGLETLNMNKSHKQKLRAFQLKGIRQILKKKTTFINRNNSGINLFKAANNICKLARLRSFEKKKKSKKWYDSAEYRQKKEKLKTELRQRIEREIITPIDDYIMLRASEYLGHIFSADRNDVCKIATLNSEFDGPNIFPQNRVGRPYILWYADVGNFIWQHVADLWGEEGTAFNFRNREHRFLLQNAAEQRIF